MFYSEKDDREKQLRFSIRKVSFGAASVAVAALYLFMGSGAVSAAEAQTIQSNEEVAADKDSETEKKSEDPQLTYAAPAAKEQGSATNTEAGDEDSVSGDSSSPKSEGEGTRSEEASSKPKVRKRREADPAPPATAADDDLDANQVYTAPVDDASVEDLATKLKALPETVENEKKLANIDQVGATKSINPGEVSELDEFGGWKAVNGGKFGVARKTDNGVFPIETVNTVRTQNGKDKTWLNESSFERSKNYALFLGLVRTKATEQEEVDDRSKYTQEGDYSNKGKGVTKYKGIEKTFKNYSPETGSDVTVSFYTGITGDIDRNKAGYKVEVIAKTAEGNETIIYNQSFYPQNEISDENKIVKKLNLGRDAVLETNRSQTEDKKNELTEKLGEDSNKRRLGTSHGTFTSKNISLASGVTEYTVRISAADNKKLGMGFQVPWRQYALPVVGTGFRVTQDTRKVAKDLAKKVYDELARQKEKDTKWSTSETKAAYDENLQKIKEKIESGASTTDYQTVVEEAIEKQKNLNEEKKIKHKAADEIAEKAAEKLVKIDDDETLSENEKRIATEKVIAEAEKAAQKVKIAIDQDGVEKAKTDGIDAITKVNPVGKEKAKKAIQDELDAKLQAIDNNDKLSQDEKDKAKADATAKAQAQKEAIDNQPANANTPEEATKAQGIVDTAQATGQADIKKVNPVGKEKAKKAIQD
ncbi:YSIRK-type signal peptide-containing protein, partial [Streptococcus sp. 6178]|uniref:YSIRK-type signal peptide-containing protein n=1 Tax=Streptococcus sp. 6178 TaxID=2582684 RepID=UPI0015621D09